MPPRLEDPLTIGPVELANRLYRAPLLEVAGNRPDAARILERELVPSAAAGCGLVFQGACLVTSEGGRTAPGLSRVHDPAFVRSLAPAVEAVKAHGAALFLQLGHGALQCMELWHARYRGEHPGLITYAVSKPPWWFRVLTRTPVLFRPSLKVFETEELHALARSFGRAAKHAVDAGYDGIHLAGANASIFQQLWSPVFNRRTDEFGGPLLRDRARFLERVVEEIRNQTRPDLPIALKVPAETTAPFFVRGHLTLDDGVEISRIAADLGIDAVVPVQVGVTRDQSVARGAFPSLAWHDPRFLEDYRDVFGSRWRAALVRGLNRLAARALPFEPTWNAGFCQRVKEVVEVPVLCEGGVRTRAQMDRLLAEGTCDAVGMARPFYAEPRAAHRLLHEQGAEVLCRSCNNCTIPQITGAVGVCRTPDVLAERGRMMKEGRYG